MFHRHLFQVTSWHHIDVYNFEANGDPDREDTKFNLLCLKCGKAKSERIKGQAMSSETAVLMVNARGWQF